MSLISKLNARFGRYAVPNLTLILIGGQVFLYLAKWLSPAQGGDVLEKVRLYPAYVLDGEVWRLVTFLFDPPAAHPAQQNGRPRWITGWTGVGASHEAQVKGRSVLSDRMPRR